MSIILDKDAKIVVQGITGHQGSFHTGAMREFGTKIVAGVVPERGGERVAGVPVYDTMKEAVEKRGADTSIIFVPAKFAKDAVIEAIDNGIKLIVIVTEHIPFHDMTKILEYSKIYGTRIIGPNCPGIASVGKSKVGIMPNSIFRKGHIGVLSRSGTLTYEVVNLISEAGFGETTVIGLGGDQVPGTTFTDCLGLFESDRDTEAIVIVGEIGGAEEEKAAEYIKKNMKKPVVAYIAGKSAPPGKRMGHAGAIIMKGLGTAESKIKALRRAGVAVADTPYRIPKLLSRLID